jgi:hypothetical protein
MLMEATSENLFALVRALNPVPEVEVEVERLRMNLHGGEAVAQLLEGIALRDTTSTKQSFFDSRWLAWMSTTRYAAATALLLAVGVSATPAFGFIRDLFEGSPAPPPVTKSLSTQNQLAQAQNSLGFTHWPEVDPSTARGVLTVQTGDGPLYLWATQQVGGTGVCWFIGYGSDMERSSQTAPGEGSCTQTPTPPSRIQMSYGWGEGHLSMDRVSGYVYADADAVKVKLANGTTQTLPVTEHLFLGVLPRGSEITQVQALDASGAVVASRPVVGSAP